MSTPLQRSDRVIHLAAAAAVAALALCGAMTGLSLPAFTDGGLDIAWSEAARSTDFVRGQATATLLLFTRGIVLAAVGVSLITMTVLALAQASRRHPQAATRAALGATPSAVGRWAVMSQLRGAGRWILMGTGVGLALGACVRVTWPGTAAGPVSATALGWTLVGAIAVPAVLGLLALVPVLRASPSLRSKIGTGTVLLRYPTGLRWLLPIVQLGVTGGLLTAAGLVARAGRNPGPETSGPRSGLVIPVHLDGEAPERARALEATLARARRQIAGPAAAATPGAFLGLGVHDQAIAECGRCYVGGMLVPLQGADVRHHAVSPDTFRTMGIQVVEGREFRAADDLDSPRVAVVNRAFAKRSFRDGGPLGRHVRLGAGLDGWYQVVGVVDGERLGPAVGGSDGPAVYVSALQHPPRDLEILVPTADPAGDGEAGAEPLGDYLSRQAEPLRWSGRIVIAAGASTLILSLVGLLAVMMFIASRRRREIALRMALGADARAVRRLLLSEGARLVFAGLVAGAWTTTVVFAVTSELGDGLVGPVLPAALPVAALLFVAGLAGCLVVARRVSRLEPAAVLAET